MPKVWTDDTALMEGMTDNLFEALYKMPKYFLRIDDIAHSLGMPISSLLVLCVLREGKISIGEISERLCIAKPNVTPLVETLCARGLISRQRSDKDRRKVLVGLMPEGEAMVERIRGAIRDQMMSWPRDYNLSEMKRVNNALAATLEVADDVMRRRRAYYAQNKNRHIRVKGGTCRFLSCGFFYCGSSSARQNSTVSTPFCADA